MGHMLILVKKVRGKMTQNLISRGGNCFSDPNRQLKSTGNDQCT